MKKLIFLFLLIPSLLFAASGSDDFNRSNSSPLSGSWATGFPNNEYWALPDIVSSQVQPHDTGGYIGAHFTGFAAQPNQWAQIKVVTLNDAEFDFVAAIVRSDGKGNFYYCLTSTGGYTEIGYWQGLGTTNTVLTYTTGTPWATGTLLRLSITGDALDCTKDGKSVLTANDSTLTSGQPGFFMFSSTTAANIVFDDFSASDIGGATVVRHKSIVMP
jgi:hypothetical protein